MNLMRKSRFLSIILCLSIILYKTCAKTIPNTQDTKERTELSERDLLQNYETLWRNAVTRDTIISEMSSQKDKYVSINNGQDFNIPINDKIMSRPIGTYQYIDTDGNLHIVNYINGPNGLSILNDYKPYASLESKSRVKNIRSNDPKTKNLKNEIKGNEFSNEKYSVGEQTEQSIKDINYDEFEFTFMPQEINKSINNNKINVLNTEESNNNHNKQLSPNLESNNKFTQNNDNNYETIHRLTQLMNFMPLPQPFSLPNHSPLLFQIPEQINDYWGGTPSNQNNPNGVPTQGSPSNTQPFFNWNQNY